MKREEATAISEAAITELSEQLASGKTEELERYLTTMSTFHDYSFGNCMLIAQQRPNATLVAGFRTWQNKHGRSVKKGEKGICILAPMIRKNKGAEDEDSGVFGYRAVHVFDVSQTEGDELPEPNRVSGDPGEKLSKLHQVTATRGITLTYSDDLGGADGRSKNGSIELSKGLTPAEEFSTLAHEIAHEALHWGEERGTTSKQVKELEAEAVSFVVSKAAGLNNALKQTADYIQSYDGDAEQLSKSLSRIQKAASSIITELEASNDEELAPVICQSTQPSTQKDLFAS